MLTSDRLARLGSGVFDRNDRRKAAYGRSSASAQRPLIDLSLGSTDLLLSTAPWRSMASTEPASPRPC